MTKSRTPKARPVTVSKKVRDTAKWFEEGCEKAKKVALEIKRAKLKAEGRPLKPAELKAIVDELEKIQLELNPLEVQHEELSKKLLAHWAHTDLEEVESEAGKTLLSISYKLTLNPNVVEYGLEGRWARVTENRLNPSLLLAMAEKDESVRPLALRAASASATVSVIPPSSRRPKSGETETEEDEK